MFLQYRFIIRWENSSQHIPLECDEKMMLLFLKKQQEVSRGHSLPGNIHTSAPHSGIVAFEVLHREDLKVRKKLFSLFALNG